MNQRSLPKRMLSCLLVAALVMGMLVLGNVGTIQAGASLSSKGREIVFVVPEVIYMAPSTAVDNNSNTGTWQYFVGSKLKDPSVLPGGEGNDPTTYDYPTSYDAFENETTPQEVGLVYFYCPGAVKVQVMRVENTENDTKWCTYVERVANNEKDTANRTNKTWLDMDPTWDGAGSNNKELMPNYKSDWQYYEISNKSFSYLKNVGIGEPVKWCAAYQLEEDGEVYHAYAYSYIYRPQWDLVGAATDSTLWGNDGATATRIHSISWLNGFHSYINNDVNDYGETVYYTANPPTHASNSLHIFTGNYKRAAKNISSHRDGTVNAFASASSDNPNIGHQRQDADGENGSVDENDAAGDWGHFKYAYSPTAQIMVDTSRYTNLNQIPQLVFSNDAVGFNESFGDRYHARSAYYETTDVAGDLINVRERIFKNAQDSAKIVDSDYSAENWNGVGGYLNAGSYDEHGGGEGWDTAAVRNGTSIRMGKMNVPLFEGEGTQELLYTVETWEYRDKDTKDSVEPPTEYHQASRNVLQLDITRVDKSALRAQAQLEFQRGSTLQKKYFEGDVTQLLKEYQDALEALCTNLGDPTKAPDNTLITAVDDAYNALEPKRHSNNAKAEHYNLAKDSLMLTENLDYHMDEYVTGERNNTLVGAVDFSKYAYQYHYTPTDEQKTDISSDYFAPDVTKELLWKFYYLPIYNVVYAAPAMDAGETLPAEVTMTYGETVATVGNGVERTGYSFEGWEISGSTDEDLNGEILQPGDPLLSTLRDEPGTVTLNAVWEANTYSVIYELNGGTGTKVTDTVDYDDEYTTQGDIYTRLGHDFTGWNTTPTGEDGDAYAKAYPFDYQIDDDLTLYAQWTPQKYTITYKLQGGNIDDETDDVESEVTFGGKFSDATNWALLQTAERAGYTFGGWYPDDLYEGTKITDESTISTELGDDYVLYAKWNPDTDTPYLVNVYVQDAAGNYGTPTQEDETGATDSSVTLASNAYNPNTTLYAKDDSQANVLTGTITVDPVMELTVYYKRLSFDLILDLNDGSDPETKGSYPWGSSVNIGQDPTRSGYTFTGWTITPGDIEASQSKDGDTEEVTVIMGKGDTTLTAQWSPVTYAISYNKNNENATESMADTPAVFNTEVTLSVNAYELTGYRFDGWATTASGAVVYANGYKFEPYAIAGNLELFAVWSAKSYTVSYDDNSDSDPTLTGEMDDAPATYDALFTPVANAYERTGYTFTGWNSQADGTGSVSTADATGFTYQTDGNLTLYAQWAGNPYTITYYKGHEDATGTMAVQNVIFGAATTLEENTFERTGYHFAGWAASAGGTKVYDDKKTFTAYDVAENQELYALWEANAYTVSYKPNGSADSEITPDDVLYNASYTTQGDDIYTRPGYTFTGWNTADDGEGIDYEQSKAFQYQIEDDLVLFAQWSGNPYKIIYDKNHTNATGTMADQNVIFGDDVTLTANTFERPGYEFAGWATSSTGSMVYADKADLKPYSPVGNLTLFALWNALGTVEYTINVYLQDETGAYPTQPSSSTTGDDGTADANHTISATAPANYFLDETKSTALTLKIQPNGSTVYELYYARNTVTLSYDLGSGTGITAPTATFLWGSAYPIDVTGLTNPGYTLTGWSTTNAGASVSGNTVTLGTENTTVKAIWAEKVSVATFNLNYDGAPAPTTHNLTFNDTYQEGTNYPAEPSRTGYDFAGWQDSSGSITIVDGATITVTGDITFYAQWTALTTIQYKINIHLQDAVGTGYTLSTALSTQPTDGEADQLKSITAPAVTDYDFNSPKTGSLEKTIAANGSTVFDLYYDRVTVQLFYNLNGGGGITAPSTEFRWGSSYDINRTGLVRTGYNFVQWNTTSAGASVSGNTVTLGTEDTWVNAEWAAKSYPVQYIDGGTVIDDTLTFGSTYGDGANWPGDPAAKPGYIFDGWYSDAEGLGTKVLADTPVSAALSETTPTPYYAVWAADDAIVCNVEIYLQDASGNYSYKETRTKHGTMDQQVTVTGAFYSPGEGYVFAEGHGENVLSQTVTAAGATLKLYYRRVTVALSYNLAGGTGITAPSQQFMWESTHLVDRSSLTRTGYDFKEWVVTAGDATIAGDTVTFGKQNVTLTAVWTAKTYQVPLHDSDGTELERITATYGENYPADFPAMEHTEDWHFIGWFDVAGNQILPGSKVQRDDTEPITAYYARYYTVIYDANGGSITGSTDLKTSRQVWYTGLYSQGTGGSPAFPSADQTGFVFGGWYTADGQKVESGDKVLFQLGQTTKPTPEPPGFQLQGDEDETVYEFTLFAKWNAEEEDSLPIWGIIAAAAGGGTLLAGALGLAGSWLTGLALVPGVLGVAFLGIKTLFNWGKDKDVCDNPSDSDGTDDGDDGDDICTGLPDPGDEEKPPIEGPVKTPSTGSSPALAMTMLFALLLTGGGTLLLRRREEEEA